MARYRFLAYDTAGNQVTSVIEATSADTVKQRLWADGLFIVQKIDRRQYERFMTLLDPPAGNTP